MASVLTSSASRAAALRLLAARIGYATRKAHAVLSQKETDCIRFLSPLADVLEDIGDAVQPHPVQINRGQDRSCTPISAVGSSASGLSRQAF